MGLDYRLLEQGSRLCGDHTWSSHETDFTPSDLDWIKELATYSWVDYTVRFHDFERTIAAPYLTIRSEDLRNKLGVMIPAHKVILHTHVHRVGLNAAETNRGIFLAKHIVRADGFPVVKKASGFQKFVGWDLRFDRPHGLKAPVIMDARVKQVDGYRFFYLLPFDDRSLLVEETRYSNEAQIDEANFADGIRAYVAENFPDNPWEILRREQASLPIPLTAPLSEDGFGVAGGFFHPTTGYSLPYAARSSRDLIEFVRAGFSVGEAIHAIREARQSTQNYYYLLNRMMFLAARPEERFKIFERFYRFNLGLITRFYAGDSTFFDKARMLVGKPPVRIIGALKVLSPQREAPTWN